MPLIKSSSSLVVLWSWWLCGVAARLGASVLVTRKLNLTAIITANLIHTRIGYNNIPVNKVERELKDWIVTEMKNIDRIVTELHRPVHVPMPALHNGYLKLA